MTRYIQGKDGKLAGSIGSGKDTVPTAAPTLPTAPIAADEVPEYGQRLIDMLQSMNDKLDQSSARWKTLERDLTDLHERTNAELAAIKASAPDLAVVQALADQAWADLQAGSKPTAPDSTVPAE